MNRLSPRLRATLRYSHPFEPWFWPLVGENMRGELRAWTGPGWVEIVIRRKGQRAFGILAVVPRATWDAMDESFREEILMGYLDSVKSFGPQDGPGRPVVDERFKKKYPAIFDFVSCSAYPDGEVRTPSCFTVFAEDGAFKIVLAERDRNLSLWGTGATFEEALQCLEDRLKADRPDWRKARPQGGKKKG